MVLYRIRRKYKTYRNPRVQKIQTLANSPDQFYTEIFAPGSKNIETTRTMTELVNNTPEWLRTDKKFHRYFGKALVNLLEANVSEKKKPYYGNTLKPHNMEYTDLINYCDRYIDEDTREKILDIIIEHNRNFYANGRKELSKIATKYLPSCDDRAFNVLRAFYRTITEQDFTMLMHKIEGGTKNPGVKEILSKTKLFDYLKYDEETVKENYEEKVKLVKAVAKTPTLSKRLPFVLKIGLKELKEVAPAMRFKFVQFAFKHELQYTRYGWNYGENLRIRIATAKRRAKEDRLDMDKISVEEMKDLLFAVCLKKNAEFTKWIKDYAIYLACEKSDVKINTDDVQV